MGDATNDSMHREIDLEIGLAKLDNERVKMLGKAWSESEEIICPYCSEEQEYQGGRHYSKVFFSEGNHKLECYQCGNIFRVNTEIRYVYEVEGSKENDKN